MLLVNLTKGYHDSEREFLGQVSEVLRDENFRIIFIYCRSCAFWSFMIKKIIPLL